MKKSNVAQLLQAKGVVMYAFGSWEKYDVIDCPFVKDKANGNMIMFKHDDWGSYYYMDIRADMDSYGNFNIDTTPDGWLRSSEVTSDRICHVCLETNWIVWYSREAMIKWLRDNSHLRAGSVQITARHKLPFITKRKVNQKND